MVIFLAQLGEFKAATSELVVQEVERFFRREVSREAGYLAVRFVESLTQIVPREQLATEMTQFKGRIKDRDLENLAVVKHESLKHLVSYDDDYRKARVREYITPRSFVRLFDLDPYRSEY